MIFTKREREMVRDAVRFFAGQTPLDRTATPEQWLSLLRRVDTWNERHLKLEGNDAIMRGRASRARKEAEMTRPKTNPKGTWEKRKPHCRETGYVASQKCKLADCFIVIYDTQKTGRFGNDLRWVIVADPIDDMSRRVYANSEAMARIIMNGVALSTTYEEAALHGHLLDSPAVGG